MADVSAIDSSRILQSLPGFTVELFQVETTTAGTTGVTFTTRMHKILNAQVTSNEDGLTGPFTVSWSGQTVTVEHLDDTGDEATVSVMVVGYGSDAKKQ